MPDKTIVKGLAEKGIKKLKVGEVCQFERLEFVRLDKKEKTKLSPFRLLDSLNSLAP